MRFQQNKEKSSIKKSVITIIFDQNIKSNRFDGKVLKIKIEDIKNASLYKLRLVLRNALRTAQAQEIENLTIDFNDIYKLAELAHVKSDVAKVVGEELSRAEIAQMLGYEFVLANYNFTDYISKKKDAYNGIKNVYINNIDNKEFKELNIGQEIAEVVNKSRTVSNTPAQDMTPEILATLTKDEFKNIKNTTVKILNKKQIQEQKMGALLGVAQGSSKEPKLITIEYKGGNKSDKPLVLIGKAVTYDTGGLGLKPAEGMVDMHMDMSGGSVTMYTLLSIAKLGLKCNVVGIIPVTENAIGKDSYRNGDILKSMSGKTIEVRHTDAEGRLILADAITYAQKHYKPKAIIDIATLTGAALVAIGQHASLIMTNSCKSKLPNIARKCGAETGNKVWQMPVWDVYKTHMKSKVADISNLSNVRWGGAITAAAFLSEFLDKDQDWMHIDIAPRMEAVEGDNLAHGATGEPVYLLTKLADRV